LRKTAVVKLLIAHCDELDVFKGAKYQEELMTPFQVAFVCGATEAADLIQGFQQNPLKVRNAVRKELKMDKIGLRSIL